MTNSEGLTLTEVHQRDVPPGDPHNDMLELIAGGRPWVFLVTTASDEGDKVDMKVETGGGITNVGLLRKVLQLALEAIEGQV